MVSVCYNVDLIDTFNSWHVMNLLIVEYRFMGCFECIGITGGGGDVKIRFWLLYVICMIY